MNTPLLEAKKLTIQFGGLKAVSELDLAIPEGSIFGLIGPNGAGKTTAFNLLTGVYAPTSGDVQFQGQSLLGLRPFEIARKGMARTFQNIRLFKSLTLEENLMISMDGSPEHQHFGLVASLFRTPALTAEEEKMKKHAEVLLRVFGLTELAHTDARNLPYGHQRRLEILRALATGAKMILLDEPAAGMNPQETVGLMDALKQVRDRFGVTILLIEHDMKLVMGISERIAVLDYGVKIAEGTPAEVRGNPRVIEAYLGKAASHG